MTGRRPRSKVLRIVLAWRRYGLGGIDEIGALLRADDERLEAECGH